MTSLDSALHSVWEPLTAIGTISVAIIAIWGDWFRAKFAAPKMRIVVRDNGVDIRTMNPLVELPIGNPSKAIYFCLHVENRRSWAMANNCKVVLRAVHRRVPNGKFYREPLIVPLQYQWSPGFYSVCEMQNIKQDAVLDFGRIVEKGDRFEPVLCGESNNFNVFKKKENEVVRYSLQIIADNFTSQKFQVFEVEWSGYSANVEDMRQSQQIKPVLKIREITENELKQTIYVT